MYTSVDDTGWSCRPRGGAGDGWTLMAGGPRQLRTVTDASAQRQDVADRALRHLAMSVSRAWSLHEVVTDSGVPLVGPVGRRRRCLTATGLGQWGPAGAAAAAVLLADLVNGAPSPSAELFDPHRQRPAKPRDAVRAAWVSARRPKSTVALPALPTDPPSPGTGVVGRSRRSAVAVSSDGDGNATAVSARCTHRGCIVRFDDADQQWECPCHGSRFDRSGAIIDGPATVPLNPVRPVA
jgi:Rieske Fe-S protein